MITLGTEGTQGDRITRLVIICNVLWYSMSQPDLQRACFGRNGPAPQISQHAKLLNWNVRPKVMICAASVSENTHITWKLVWLPYGHRPCWLGFISGPSACYTQAVTLLIGFRHSRPRLQKCTQMSSVQLWFVHPDARYFTAWFYPLRSVMSLPLLTDPNVLVPAKKKKKEWYVLHWLACVWTGTVQW